MNKITNNLDVLRKKKLFKRLIIITVISLILSLIYLLFLNKANSKIVTDSIYNYFNNIKSNKIEVELTINNIKNILIVNTLSFILSISIIGIIILPIILMYKTFILGFKFFSIIKTFGISGIIKSLIYASFNIINICLYILLVYIGIDYSYKLINYLFLKKNYELKRSVVKLIKYYLIITILSILISVLGNYITIHLLSMI